MGADQVLPRLDPDGRPYWEAAAQGRLEVQFCTACATPRFYPRLLCPNCHSDRVEWRAVSGAGTVYSYSVVHRAPAAPFAADVPYTVALIELDEGVRMLSRVVGESTTIRIGDRVSVRFRSLTDEVGLPEFVRDEQEDDQR